MGILENVINGATSQFGREFGRAGANIILKGKNNYSVNDLRYEGRIKPSDNKLIKMIKEIKKIDFVTTNKANISRLIEITNIANDCINFEGESSISFIDDYYNLIEVYNEKFEHGRVLIDDNYQDKSLDFLVEKRDIYKNVLEKFNEDVKNYLKSIFLNLEQNKRIKSTATRLGFPIWGFTGIMNFYLNNKLIGIISLLTTWTIFIPIYSYIKNQTFTSAEMSLEIIYIFTVIPILNILYYCYILTLSEEEFDNKYNKKYVKMREIVSKL